MRTEHASDPRLGGTGRPSVAAVSILLAAAWSAALLCGGMPEGSLGVFLLGAGGVMVFVPPRRTLPWSLWMVSALLVGWCGLALLPAGAISQPVWRQSLEASGLFPALSQISLVPRESLFWMVILATSLLAGLYVLSHPVGSSSLVGIGLGTCLACAVYAGLAIYAVRAGWKAPFDGSGVFGFFPNRNHAATLLITGCLTGLGAVFAALSRRWFLAAGIGIVGILLPVVALLLYSPSRGGVIFLVIGAAVWIAGLGRGRFSTPVVVSVVAISLTGLVYLFGTQNPVRERLVGMAEAVQEKTVGSGDVPLDFRMKIYRDTFPMLRDFPITGTGLGTYETVYPFYARLSLAGAMALHPESDWLMLAVEAGPVAVVLALVLVGLAGRGVFGERNSRGWPARWGFVSAALAAGLHGAVDVPLHRVELGWWVLVLAAIGLAVPGGTRNPRAARIQHLLFVVAGAGILVLGWKLVAAEWRGGPALPPFEAAVAGDKILALYKQKEVEAALDLAVAATAKSPMAADLYYQRGVLELHFEETDKQVDASFAAARLLRPNLADTAWQQAVAWLPVDSDRAAALFREAVDTSEKIVDRNHTRAEPGLIHFERALGEAGKHPKVLALLMPRPDDPPAFHFAWLAASPDAPGRILELSSTPAFLERIDQEQRARFLKLWFDRGDRTALFAFLDARPGWSEREWELRARDLAEKMDHHAAVDLLCRKFAVDLSLPAPGTPAVSPPSSPLADQFFQLWSKSNVVAARRILQEALAENSPALSEAHRLGAAMAAQEGKWPTAYNELVAYLHASQLAPEIKP
ncbi:MAG: O-antigen ligase family protein [Verrucomicrobiae bacterium]